MAKPIIITSLKIKKRGQVKALRDLCKYLQYRDGSVRRESFLGPEHHYPEGVSDYVRPEHRDPKWVDRGMGETYKQIANRAYDWQGRRMLARTWVISPDPELMKHIPDEKRFEVVRNVTEKTLDRWYSDNGWGQPEYSYVIHDKHRVADGEQMVHSHVITSATIPVDSAGELGRIDHYVARPHIRDLHRTTAETFEEELGRVLGKDRAQELITERNARLERERDPGRSQRERFKKLRTLADIVQLLEAEREARRVQKENKKQKRNRQQIQAELRMYARYITEERHKRHEADYQRIAAARQEEQDAELERERTRHRGRVAHIVDRGKPIPTYAEVLEQEEKSRRSLQVYYASLFSDARRERGDRAQEYEEIER
jgi:ribosomal protein S28E/S33